MRKDHGGSKDQTGPDQQTRPDQQALLRAQLSGVRDAALAFAASDPEAAARGLWWRKVPLDLRDHPDAGPQRVRQAAVLVLMWESPQGPQVLLTQRSATMSSHAGQVSFPGGAQDDDDDGPIDTALREAHEEVALDRRRVEVIGALPPAPVPVSGFMVTPVLAVTADPGTLVPEAREVQRVLRVPLDTLADPALRRTAVLTRGGMRLASPAFLLGEGPPDGPLLWGFTAILLDRVMDHMGWSRPWDDTAEIDPFSPA